MAANYRLQRGVELLLHQRVGGVVAAGGLARVAARGGAGLKTELAVAKAELGHQLQQAFVDAAQLLGTHVAPIDAGERAVGAVAQPGQVEQRQQQVAVFQPAGVECGALRGIEQATQRRQGQQGFANGQALPDLLERLPQVAMPVVRAAAHGAFAQATQAVALGVQRHGGRVGIAAVQDVALFHRQQEDLAIDQAQQLAQVVLRRQAAAAQRLAQRGVGWVADEALAKHQQGVLDTDSQGLARAGALFAAGIAPLLQCAVAGCRTFGAKAGGVQQQPEHREVGVAFFSEQALQVHFHPGRAGEAGVVAGDAQLQAVGGHAPQCIGQRVQAFLQQAEGAAAADALA